MNTKRKYNFKEKLKELEQLSELLEIDLWSERRGSR